MLVIPRTKHIASRILDFPDPFNPVIALKDSSKPTPVISDLISRTAWHGDLPLMVVRTGYDLKPVNMSTNESKSRS